MSERNNDRLEQFLAQKRMIFNNLQHEYNTSLRKSFFTVLRPSYCKYEEKVPYLESQLKECCTHDEVIPENTFNNQEILGYASNFLKWMDVQMKHFPEDSTTKPCNKRKLKTCTFGLGENTYTVCLKYTNVENGETEEQNGDLESVTSEKDEEEIIKKRLEDRLNSRVNNA